MVYQKFFCIGMEQSLAYAFLMEQDKYQYSTAILSFATFKQFSNLFQPNTICGEGHNNNIFCISILFSLTCGTLSWTERIA